MDAILQRTVDEVYREGCSREEEPRDAAIAHLIFLCSCEVRPSVLAGAALAALSQLTTQGQVGGQGGKGDAEAVDIRPAMLRHGCVAVIVAACAASTDALVLRNAAWILVQLAELPGERAALIEAGALGALDAVCTRCPLPGDEAAWEYAGWALRWLGEQPGAGREAMAARGSGGALRGLVWVVRHASSAGALRHALAALAQLAGPDCKSWSDGGGQGVGKGVGKGEGGGGVAGAGYMVELEVAAGLCRVLEAPRQDASVLAGVGELVMLLAEADGGGLRRPVCEAGVAQGLAAVCERAYFQAAAVLRQCAGALGCLVEGEAVRAALRGGLGAPEEVGNVDGGSVMAAVGFAGGDLVKVQEWAAGGAADSGGGGGGGGGGGSGGAGDAPQKKKSAAGGGLAAVRGSPDRQKLKKKQGRAADAGALPIAAAAQLAAPTATFAGNHGSNRSSISSASSNGGGAGGYGPFQAPAPDGLSPLIGALVRVLDVATDATARLNASGALASLAADEDARPQLAARKAHEVTIRLCEEARDTADETMTELYEHAAETVHLLAEDERLQALLTGAGARGALAHVRAVLGVRSWLFDPLQGTIDYLETTGEERKEWDGKQWVVRAKKKKPLKRGARR